MRTLQSHLQNVNHGLVRGFGLSVGLGVSGCSEGELYAPVLAKLLEVVACELGSVVGDNLLWNPKAGDHVRPHELLDLKVCYSAECLCISPFREVVSYYQEEDLQPRRCRDFFPLYPCSTF